MDRKYKVGGYVKLAKLWERSKDAAVAYHSSYYAEKFRDDADKRLVGVYADLTKFALLEHYGGTWIDSTVYLTDPIPDMILNSDFFAVRNSLLLIDNPVLYPAWFLHAKKGNKTIREIRNVAFAYWLKNEHVIEYLLPNLIITLVVKSNPEVEKAIPYMNSDYSEYANKDTFKMLRLQKKQRKQKRNPF